MFNKINSLKQRANSAISIFTKTKNNLQKLNEEIEDLKAVKNNEIKNLNAEITELNFIYNENDNIISNIDKILK